MRKGPIYIDDRKLKALTVAKINSKGRRSLNTEYNPNHTKTGLFKEFDLFIREIALRYNYDGVFIELVHNEFLPEVLLRYGYTQVNEPENKSFWISVRTGSTTREQGP